MTKIILIIIITVLIFSLVCCGATRQIALLFLDGYIWGAEILGIRRCLVSELKNTDIVFTVNKLVMGKHDLEIGFVTSGGNAIQNPNSFKFTVQIRKGKNVKEKTFTRTFQQEISFGIFYLFDVPDDFFPSKNTNMEITIKDFVFDDVFAEHVESVVFVIHHRPFMGHYVNILNDGERIYRNDGFKTW